MNCVFFSPLKCSLHFLFAVLQHIHKTCSCSFSLAHFLWDKPERLHNNIILKHSHAFSFFLFFFCFTSFHFMASLKFSGPERKKQPHYVTETKWMTTFRENFNSVTFLQPAHFKTSAFFFLILWSWWGYRKLLSIKFYYNNFKLS